MRARTAEAAKELQKRLSNARVLCVSATGATEIVLRDFEEALKATVGVEIRGGNIKVSRKARGQRRRFRLGQRRTLSKPAVNADRQSGGGVSEVRGADEGAAEGVATVTWAHESLVHAKPYREIQKEQQEKRDFAKRVIPAYALLLPG